MAASTGVALLSCRQGFRRRSAAADGALHCGGPTRICPCPGDEDSRDGRSAPHPVTVAAGRRAERGPGGAGDMGLEELRFPRLREHPSQVACDPVHQGRGRQVHAVVGRRQRHHEIPSRLQPYHGRTVEHPLRRRSQTRGHGEGHRRAVIVQVQVHDGRDAQVAQAVGELLLGSRQQPGDLVVGHGEDGGTGLECGAVLEQQADRTATLPVDRRDTARGDGRRPPRRPVPRRRGRRAGAIGGRWPSLCPRPSHRAAGPSGRCGPPRATRPRRPER